MGNEKRKRPPGFRLGLVAGILGGVVLGRKLVTSRRMPGLSAWQRALAEKRGEAEAAMLAARVQARYDELCAQRPHFANIALRAHLEGNILPGLALYQVLREERDDQAVHLGISHPAAYPLHQTVVVDVIEASPDISLHDPLVREPRLWTLLVVLGT